MQATHLSYSQSKNFFKSGNFLIGRICIMKKWKEKYNKENTSASMSIMPVLERLKGVG